MYVRDAANRDIDRLELEGRAANRGSLAGTDFQRYLLDRHVLHCEPNLSERLE